MVRSLMKFMGLVFLLFYVLTTGCSLPSGSSASSVSVTTATYKEAILVEYSLTQIKLKLLGEIPSQGTTLLNSIEFHTQSDCSGTAIGAGLASDFIGAGIQVTIPMPNPRTKPTDIYLKTNTLKQCLFLTSYTFDAGVVAAPVLTSTSPASPSRSNYQPAIFGGALPNSTVNLYSNSACTTLVGSGTAADFTTIGINTTLTANHASTIYGQTVDALSEKSACTLLTTYVHTTSGPDAPSFSLTTPYSPSRIELTPLVKGTVSTDTEKIKIFSDSSCSTELVEGTKNDFTSTGLMITVTENTTTTLYAVAYDAINQPSLCTYLSTYIHDNVSSSAPLFTTTNPLTPTRQTIYPKVIGQTAADVAAVRLYQDVLCLQPIGYGTKAEFESTGVTASVQTNAITSIYAISLDAAGNPSVCQYLTAFKHNTIAPDVPIFGGTTPVSPNNVTANPLVYGNASISTKNVYFYSDDTCATPLGFGTAADFNSTGISIATVAIPNSVNLTTIYTQADDLEGNVSDCTAISSYAYSTAAAASPAFLQTIPLSPSKSVTQPWILGTSPSSIVTVQLFKDNSCSQFLGSASRTTFATQGIKVTLPANTRTQIYSIAGDVYGSTSACTYLTDYVHDAIVPLDPSFISSTPASPNNSSITPSILGGITINIAGKPLPVSVVNFFDSFLCLSNIGYGDPNLFSTSGLPISVPANAVTTIYAQAADAAGNVSNCTSMLNYTHSNRAPGRPLFGSATPATPSYTNKSVFAGTLGATQDIVSPTSVLFYKDSSCSTLLTTGSVGQYTSTGVSLVLDANATTPVYARTIDLVGNLSACTQQVDYAHHDNGPSGLNVSQNQDGSVTLGWQPDSAASPTPFYTVKRATKAGGPYSVLIWQNAGTSFTDYSVNQGKTYFYVVSALNNTGYSKNSSEVSITINSSVAQTPTVLAASSGPAVVQLSWQGYTPNMYYNILRATQAGGPYTEIKSHYAGSQYDDITVANNTTYYYVVIGLNPAGSTIYSNEASATPVDVPSAPTNLKIDLVNNYAGCSGADAAILHWTPPSYYVSFVVGRGNNNPSSFVDHVTLTNNSYVDCLPDPLTNPPPQGRDIYYSVQATWGQGSQVARSARSNTVVMRNKVGPVVTVDPGFQETYVRWAAVLTAVDYQVWRSTKPGWPNEQYTLLNANFNGTTYYDTSLTNGQDYYYVVIANYTAGGTGWPSVETSGVPGANPSPPSNLVLNVDSTKNINLAWSAPSHANGYNIYRATNAGGPFSFLVTTTAKSYADNPGIANYYYYYVTAKWGSFETAATNTVSVRYGYPSTLTLNDGASSLDLSWAAVTGAVSYNVLRATTMGGPYTQIINTALTTLSNTTSSPGSYGLSGGVGYYYVVQPVFADATIGQYSPEKNGMLTGTNVVSGLTVTGTTSGSVNLAWAAMSGASSYSIYKSTSAGGPFTLVGTAGTTTYSVNSLTTSTTYYFKVAKTNCAPGCQSAAVSAVAVSAPSAPTVDPGNNSVTVSWSGVTGASSYDLLRSTDGVSFSLLQSGVSGGTYTDNAVSNGLIYFYQIRANYPTAASLISAASLPVTPGVVPLIPTQPYISDNSNGTDVSFSWGQVSGVTRYKIYYSTTSGGPWTLGTTTSSNVDNYIMGLTTGTVYYIVVTAVNGSIESSYSPELAVIPEVTPTAPTLSSNGADINISFSALAGAANYDILRSSNEYDYVTISSHQAGLTYTDSAVVVGESYYYKYIPYDSSNIQMASSAVGGPINTNPMIAPTGLMAYAPDVNSVRLNWVFSSSTQVANYNVYRSTSSGGPYVSIAAGLASTLNTYLDSAVVPGTTYYYVVTARNFLGVESAYSNEAAVNLVSGSTNLVAVNNSNHIDLTWDAVASATGYNVYRSFTNGGPYGLISSQGATLSYTDAQVGHNQTYYYVVQAIFAGGSLSAYSNQAQITAVKTMNLQHPVELLDQAISSETTPITFERSRTSMEPTAYDGTVSYELEAVAINTDTIGADIQLVDESDAVKATLTIPANTTQATRLRTALTLNAGFETYRLKIAGTTQSGQLQVYSSRIWVTQVAASKTKLYIPLLSSANTPLSGDQFAPLESTLNTGYQVLSNSSIYLRDTTKLVKLQEYNAWELEVVVSSNGGNGAVALYNTENSAAVESAEIQFSDPGVLLVNAPFNEGVTLFSSAENLNHYRLAMQCFSNCDLGSVSIYRAGLWVNIESLAQAEILIRNSQSIKNIAASTPTDTERSLIDLSKYSNPVVNFRAIGYMSSPTGESANVSLMTNGAGGSADYGFWSLATVSGSALNFTSATPQLKQTASPLTINSLDRFVPQIDPLTGAANLIESSIVIQASP